MTASSPSSRLLELDALRGFALMGLFLVHMVEYFELYWYAPQPGWVHSLIFGVFGGKAYGLFALLFGFSFFIIMDRNQARGVDFRRGFALRMVLLAGFGYLHSLIYAGDVLQVLALAGLLVLVLRQLSLQTLWLVAIFFLLQGPAFFYGAWALTSDASGPAFGPFMTSNFEVFANGSFAELLAHNRLDGQAAKWIFFLESGRLWNIIGLVLLGYLLAREHAVDWIRAIPAKGYMGVALLVVMAAGLFLAKAMDLELEPGLASWVAGEIRNVWFNLTLTLAIGLLFIVLFQRTPLRKVLNLLAPCGRMSLTIYMAQAFIFVPCFYGFGLAWYEDIGQAQALVYGLLAWPLFVLAAHWWFTQFHYGPLEWLWRAATYRTTNIPMRRRNSADTPPPPVTGAANKPDML